MTTSKPSSSTTTTKPPSATAATTTEATSPPPPPQILNSSSDPTTSADDAELLAAAAAAAAARAQSPRPIFPWRHEPLDNPLPRLTPGTPEYAFDNATRMGGWAERSLSYWFLGVPPLQAVFRFGKWKREFAEIAAYAFTQAVAGIVSNTYRIPLEQVISNDNNNSNDDDDDEVRPKVHFKFPSNIDLPLAPTSKEQKESGEPVADSNKNKETTQRADQKGDLQCDSPPTSTHESKLNSNSSTVVEQQVDKIDKSKSTENPVPGNIAAAAAEKSIAKDATMDQTTTTKVGSSSPDSQTVPFCPQVQDMMIRPLRNLFESAHESGKDQLIIHLEMEPIHAYFYNIFCYPYVTREMAEKDPDRIKMVRGLKRLKPAEGFGKVVETLNSDMDRKGRLETTVEVQVLVICNEVFQVLDRTSGAVLQGSKDGAVQTVCHVVRLENTALQVLPEDGNGSQLTLSNWQITDIDDLLNGPIAWYQK
jgi:hypothetical protein